MLVVHTTAVRIVRVSCLYGNDIFFINFRLSGGLGRMEDTKEHVFRPRLHMTLGLS